jgi:hypothetical protein
VARHDQEQHEVEQVRAYAAREQPRRIPPQRRRRGHYIADTGHATARLLHLPHDIEVASRDLIDVEAARDCTPRSRADRRQRVTLIERIAQCRVQRCRITHWNEPTVVTVANHLGRHADDGRDAGHSNGHRFDERKSEALALAAEHE